MLRAFFGVILAVCALGLLLIVGIGLLARSAKRDAGTDTASAESSSDRNDTTAVENGSSRPDAANVKNRSGVEAQPAIIVSAPKLFMDYHANEVQADNLYRGRRLMVRGIVTTIRKDFTDSIIVALASGNEFETVDARLSDAYAGTAATLHKWEIVDMVCQGNGMVIGSPQLKNCSIQLAHNDQTPTSPTITAPQNQEPIQQQNSSTTNGSQQPAPIIRETPSNAPPKN